MPGEEIAQGGGYLRGHGTYVERMDEAAGAETGAEVDGDKPTRLVASVAGVVFRVNKLISVRPVLSRYGGDVGDVVVGRVVEVGNKQWRVDLGARQLGTLMLGSINLPGGALRRRTLEDQLQMRSLFQENDLVSAEVSSFFQHGGVAIHTRSMRYGKLQNGVLVSVSPSLIKRMSQHFVQLKGIAVDAIFALNGRIWLTAARGEAGEDDAAAAEDRVEQSRMTDQMEIDNLRHAERHISASLRADIARVRNAILVLAAARRMIFPQSVMAVFHLSKRLGLEPKAMLAPDAAGLLSSFDDDQ